MKILFFLTSRYPTYKAYGVTTGETARAFREVGDQIKVIAPRLGQSELKLDQYGNVVDLVHSPILNILREFFFKLWLLGRPFFILTAIVFARKCKKRLRDENPDVIWVRDYWSTLVLQRIITRCKFVIEVHQYPRKLNHIVLRWLSRNQNTALLTIQNSLKEDLESRYPKARIFLGPMGANKEFYDVGIARLNSAPRNAQEVLKVCYLGRLTSSGHDNGIKSLLDDWERVPRTLASLTLIGLASGEMDELSNQKKLKNIHFLPSVSHSEVPKTLSHFDCGLIPYPEGNYHRSRFPIKIVEYCATALHVVANNTKGNRESIKESFADFYVAGNPESLVSALIKIKENPSESRKKAVAAYVWAQDYTYHKRLTEIYSFLEGCSN